VEPWFLTPVGTATTRVEMAYNAARSKTPAIVER